MVKSKGVEREGEITMSVQNNEDIRKECYVIKPNNYV